MELHGTRYTLAKEALICSGKLFDDFGCVANTPASKAVHNGTYLPLSDLDMATKQLFNKIAAIRKIIPKDSVSPVITPVQWKRYWAWPPFQPLHCWQQIGYHSHYHDAWVTVILAHAVQLECWSRGLLVMIKKTLGVMPMTKLRAILLMEVDFNASNRIIYNVRMMRQA